MILSLVLLLALPAHPPPAAPSPAQEPRVLVADSVVLNRQGASHAWFYQLEDVAGSREPQMRIWDAGGATLVAPASVIALLGAEAVQPASGRIALFIDPAFGPPLVSALALLGAGVFAVVAVRYRRRYHHEQAQRRALAASRRRLGEGREEERLRLAQELHDGPIQDLLVLRLRLSMAAAEPPEGAGGRDAGAAPAGLEDEVQAIVRDLRAISENLRPPALGPFGLAAALRSHADRFRQLHPHLTVELDLDDDARTLPEQVRLVLFRIAQEAMNNAAKHARPSRLEVTLRLDGGAVRLEVADDGIGYRVPADLNALAEQGHYGLLGMSERAESIGATLHLERGVPPAGGTRVRVEADRQAPEWQTPFMRSRV